MGAGLDMDAMQAIFSIAASLGVSAVFVKHNRDLRTGGLVGNVFINPNFHVILVHLPLGIFVLGVLIELLSFMYRRSTLRLAGRWMVLLGALATIPVAFTGIYALNDIAARSQADGRLPDNATWQQVAEGARLRDGSGAAATRLVTNAARDVHWTAETPEAWRLFSRHAWVEGSASALVALTAVLFLGLSDRMRRRLYAPALILLLGGACLMTWGAWYAGESIYLHGSATRLQKALPAAPAAEARSTDPAADLSLATDPLPQLPPFHFAPAVVVSPTSEPTTVPTTNPATEPSTTAPVPTTEPTTLPATAPVNNPAPETAPAPTPTTTAAPETAPAPTTAPAPETTPAAPPTSPTTAATTEPAVSTTIPVIPPPSVPPASVFPPLSIPPLTMPSLTVPPSSASAAPVVAPPSREPEVNKVEEVGTVAYYVGPPLQVHVLLAGLSVAFALGALGASMRRLSTLTPAPGPATPAEAALEAEETEAVLAANNAAPGRRPVTGQDIDLLRTINPDLTVTAANAPCIPAARLWLIAFLGVLLTAAIGVYFLAAPASLGGDATSLNTTVLWQAIIDKAQNPDGLLTRRLAHVIGGAALLLLPLLLAIFARWSKSKLALGVTSLLLVAVVAGQVWIGILLLYDSQLGKINHFNSAPVATPARVTSPV